MPIIDLANAIAMYTQATSNNDHGDRQLSNLRLLREAKLRLRWAYDKIGDIPELKYASTIAANSQQKNLLPPFVSGYLWALTGLL